MPKITKWIAFPLILIPVVAWLIYDLSVPQAVVGPITRGTAIQTVPANVLVIEAERREIKAEFPGKIIKRVGKVASEVKEGDVIFELDPKDLEIEIAKIETDRRALKARMDLGSPIRFEIAAAEETVRTKSRLFDQGREAQLVVDQAKRTLEQSKDRLEGEKISNQQALENFDHQLAQKRRQQEKMNVVAPIDGTITDLPFGNGDLISGGQPLGHIISKERWVQAQISEENFAGVRVGMKATVQFLGYSGRFYAATVDRILPAPDPYTKRYIAFLQVDIPQDQLVSGLTGEAIVTVDRRENTLLAETRSLVGHNLFVVKNGYATVTPVIVGYSTAGSSEIVSGVSEGDLVILQEQVSVRNGQRVRVLNVAPKTN